MQNKSIKDIVKELRELKKNIQNDPKLQAEIDHIIIELENHDNSTFDKNLDRSKKIGELLAIAMKIIFEFFAGP